jgi:hypothetical protein
MGWVDDYNASEVAQKMGLGERVLLDGKRATFMVISDGKEIYEFALEDEARCVRVDLQDLDRRVKVERWEEDPEPDWQKEGEDFVRWLRSCRQWMGSKKATIPVPPPVLKKAIRIIEGRGRDLDTFRKARDKFCLERCHAGSEEECERLCSLHGLGEKK